MVEAKNLLMEIISSLPKCDTEKNSLCLEEENFSIFIQMLNIIMTNFVNDMECSAQIKSLQGKFETHSTIVRNASEDIVQLQESI